MGNLCDRCADMDCEVRGIGKIEQCMQFKRKKDGTAIKAKRPKYGNRKTEVHGIPFDSEKEAGRYMVLKVMEKAGEIRELVLQPEIELQPSFTRNDKVILPITYRADFKYVDAQTGRTVIEDVKGMKTQVYRLKKKMMLYLGYEVKET